MQNNNKDYFILIAAHVLLGALIYFVPFIAKIYALAIVALGVYFVIKFQNKNHEVLYVVAYVIGSEVFLRMTNGNPNHEFAKYSVLLFSFMGMFYSGFSKYAVPYWIFMLLLVPGIMIATAVLNFETDIRKTIMFNISGPISLGFASLYTYNKKIRLDQLNAILLCMGLPIVSCAAYLYLYTPDLKEILHGTSSNDDLTGHFGPNQVSTIMGLGMFIFFTRLILNSRTKFIFGINLLLAFYITYRGMISFSRGGMMTGFAMIVMLFLLTYFNSKYKGKIKLNYLIVLMFIAMVAIWSFTSYQTGGLIDKRYTNKDALGREKKDKLTGRGELAAGEIQMFLENPILGVGVAKGTEIRSEENGYLTASHDEITRMLAEHGMLGIIALLILFCTPIFLYFDNKQNIYIFSFLIFWLLTINHAAMRTASPSFVYALALLKVKLDEEHLVHRE